MRKIINSLSLVALALFMTHCSNTKSAASASSTVESLSQNEWKLTEVQGADVPFSSQAGLLFSPGTVNRVSGSTGCNRMTGTYETGANHSIKFSPLATTRMACMDESVNVIEAKFLEVLSKATSWNISENELLLKDGSATLARLKPLNPSSKEENLLNGTWELNYITGSRIAFEGLFPNKKPTIIFNLPGTAVNGNSSCNGYSTTMKTDGHKIRFGEIAATMIACEGNGEQDFFKTLKTVSSYTISSDNNTLTLIMGDIAVMRFTRNHQSIE